MVNPEIFVPGSPVVIEIRDYAKTKVTSFFRGNKGREYLIVDHPKLNGRLLPLVINTPCILRFIHEGEIIGFSSIVLATIRTPSPLMFLEYPTSVETSRLRKSDRFPVNIETICTTQKLEGPINGLERSVIRNISEGGCMIETKESFEIEQNIHLTILPPEQETIHNLEVQVKRCEKKGEFYYIGTEFTDMMAESYEQVKSFLHLIEAFHSRPVTGGDLDSTD